MSEVDAAQVREAIAPEDYRGIPGGYPAVALSDLIAEASKLPAEFPNYGDWVVTLPAGHWRAILTRLSARAVERDETAWLIEHGGMTTPMYWTCEGGNWGRWNGDHSKAIRFARREDAFTVSLALGDMPHDPPHRIAEHKWMSK